jgi:hypothetical protein
MRDEYDLSRGTRGRYAEGYRSDASVRVLEGDDPADNYRGNEADAVAPVILDPEVRAIFPDSAAVNEALRLLIKAGRSAQELRRPG